MQMRYGCDDYDFDEECSSSVLDALDFMYESTKEDCAKYLVKLICETLTDEQKKEIMTKYNEFKSEKTRMLF